MSNLTKAAEDVLAERRRQIEVEGWTPEHDDCENFFDELSAAAACYIISGTKWEDRVKTLLKTLWPWRLDWWKPQGGRRRRLVKAGALVLAEIERIDRIKAREPQS